MASDVLPRESLFQRLSDRIFGYDFFLSYSHGDGKAYPRQLKAALEQAGFSVFLDQTEYVAGVDLRRETRRQVKKSSKVIVLGRAGALRSPWVLREVEVALENGKTPILVDVNDAVSAAGADSRLAALAKEQHWLRLMERVPEADGAPSGNTVAELVRSFGATRQQTRRLRALAATAAVLAGLAVLAGIQWGIAESARASLKQKVDELTAANVRLSARMKLRIAQSVPGQVGQQIVQEGWYRIASDSTRAVVVIKNPQRQPSPIVGTGFVVLGSALSERWGPLPVVVTAYHVAEAASGSDGIDPLRFKASFPGVEGAGEIEFDDVLWQSKLHDIAILGIKSALPFGAIPIERVTNLETAALPAPAAANPSGSAPSPAVIVLSYIGAGPDARAPGGVISERDAGFQLGISQPLATRPMHDFEGGPVEGASQLLYAYVTGAGASGAPVFDADTGDLLCVHRTGLRDGGEGLPPYGGCSWLGGLRKLIGAATTSGGTSP